MASRAAAAIAVTAAHFQLQYLDGFFSLKAEREKVFLGSKRGGGEYTVPDVRGYPGEELLKRGVVPDDVLNKKCLRKHQGKDNEQLKDRPRFACYLMSRKNPNILMEGNILYV